MTEQTETGASALDTVKLAAAAAILVGGIAAFYLLGTYPLAVRWAIVLASFGLGAFVALQSAQGRVFWQFVQGSRVELRKVVWPTRQETLQTALVVFIAITAMGIFFWFLDWVLGALTRALTGQGG
ncbi:MAG TPA: preprotein translocase subunit SecE [Steroidobacteraceae bacterium]|jgi:preprotein translocase subunit SecE|nr:preprotein translocase subunit SecE [Steroidobacteraceae bacterium]